MPTYEYQCRRCGRRFELFRRLSEAAKRERCACGGTAERRICAPALHGLDTGPGNRFAEQTFMRFHIPTEARNILRKMELSGVRHRNPRLWKAALTKYNAIMAKEHTYPVVDYEKQGHPLLEKNE